MKEQTKTKGNNPRKGSNKDTTTGSQTIVLYLQTVLVMGNDQQENGEMSHRIFLLWSIMQL